MGRPSKESSLKVATTRAELHKIQHKSIQVVGEGIGLENYLIRNVAALDKLTVCLRKIKNTFPSHTLWISIRMNWIQRNTQKNSGGGERRANLQRSARRQQFIIKVSSWRFYNQQEEVLNQKSPKVIDHFVFNYLAVDNTGQTADNKHTGTWFFLSFFWRVKLTSWWEMMLFRTSQ